jgi:hypothetical protein
MPYGFGVRRFRFCPERWQGSPSLPNPNLPYALPPTTPEVSAAARERRFTADGRLRLL